MDITHRFTDSFEALSVAFTLLAQLCTTHRKKAQLFHPQLFHPQLFSTNQLTNWSKLGLSREGP